MKAEEILKLALIEYPEMWFDEPDSYAHCPKQIDVNKQEREAFICGINLLTSILKDNLSVNLVEDTITDYGSTSKEITISLTLFGDEISSSRITV